MKRSLLVCLILCLVSFFCGTNLMATPIPVTVGSEITFSDFGGTLDLSDNAEVPYANAYGGAYTASSEGYKWTTFCLEIEEYLDFSSSFQIAGISNAAKSDVTVAGDPISDFTAWIYTQVVNETDLFDGHYDYAQYYIWLTEGQISDVYFNQMVDSGFAQTVTNRWNSSGWSGLGNVRVLNIMDKEGKPAQDVLVTAPVPEPSTLVLMGFGLIGLAGIGRKKFMKNP